MKTIEKKAEAYRLMIESDGYIAGRTIAQKLVDGIEAMRAYYAGYKEAEPKWISVDDRLPEQFGEYLVYPHKYSRTAYFTTSGISEIPKNSWYRDDENGYEYEVYVSHWMPLPEAPKGEE